MVVFGIIKFQSAVCRYLSHVAAQLLQQFLRRIVGAGIKNSPVAVQHDGAAVLSLRDAPQQHDLPPLLAVPLADAQRLVKKTLAQNESYLCPEVINHILTEGMKVILKGEGVNAMLSVAEQPV